MRSWTLLPSGGSYSPGQTDEAYSDAFLRKELLVAFRASNNYSASNIKLTNAVSHIAVRKLLSKVLKLRKLCVGEFLMSDRKDIITHFENNMNCCHCTERTTPIVIDENGSCKIAEENGEQNPIIEMEVYSSL